MVLSRPAPDIPDERGSGLVAGGNGTTTWRDEPARDMVREARSEPMGKTAGGFLILEKAISASEIGRFQKSPRRSCHGHVGSRAKRGADHSAQRRKKPGSVRAPRFDWI
jgi:hypothetical protein